MFWFTSELRARLAPLNSFKPSSKIFYWPFQVGTLLWIFYAFFCLVFTMSSCASVYMCFVVTCLERADFLALFVVSNCKFVTFPLVSWVKCGTWLYRFLILAPLLTLILRLFFLIHRSEEICENQLLHVVFRRVKRNLDCMQLFNARSVRCKNTPKDEAAQPLSLLL